MRLDKEKTDLKVKLKDKKIEQIGKFIYLEVIYNTGLTIT